MIIVKNTNPKTNITYIIIQLLEVNHRRLRQLEAKHQTEYRQVQERLAQEEESVVALREEARLKEEQVAKLKRSIKDVNFLILSIYI
jgi:predicted  nucleic acid-binding Zn-ribbon protein